MNNLLNLYLTYFKLGFVTFGGGYAMLPILERELADKRHWTTLDELRDYFSIGQCTPGIIALNVSTFIGRKRGGVAGAIAAGLGFMTGPIAIILLIASFLTNFADLPVIQHAFAGIRVCVCVLIIQAVLRLWNKSIIDAFTLILYLVIFLLNAFSGMMPVRVPAAVLVILSGVAGVTASAIKAGQSNQITEPAGSTNGSDNTASAGTTNASDNTASAGTTNASDNTASADSTNASGQVTDITGRKEVSEK